MNLKQHKKEKKKKESTTSHHRVKIQNTKDQKKTRTRVGKYRLPLNMINAESPLCGSNNGRLKIEKRFRQDAESK